jgi:hypothetical protein
MTDAEPRGSGGAGMSLAETVTSAAGLTPAASGAASAGPTFDAIGPKALSSSALTKLNAPLPAAVPQAAALDTRSGPQTVDSQDMSRLRNYGRQVGQDFLKDTLGVDINSLQLVWDSSEGRFVTAGDLARRHRNEAGDASGVLGDPASTSHNFSLALVQNDEFVHVSEGFRDVPFGLQLGDFLPLMASLASMHTRLTIPLSPDDEWKAEASMPMGMLGENRGGLWQTLGLGHSLAVRSDISSRLGLNQFEAGMGTKWDPGLIGIWDLDLSWYLRYGQGSDETGQWLKLSRKF